MVQALVLLIRIINQEMRNVINKLLKSAHEYQIGI